MTEYTRVESIEGMEVRLLRLEPGDRIGVHMKRRVTVEQAEAIKEQIREVFGDLPIAILGPDLDMFVIREVEE